MNNLPLIPRFQKAQVIQVFVVGAVAIMIGGIFWMVFTIAPSAIISVIGVENFASDAQTTVYFMEAAITAIPFVCGIIILAWGVVKAIEERETGVASV